METVTAHFVLRVETVRNRIDVALGGNGLVEGRVKHADHGFAGHCLLAGANAGDVCGVMQGREGDAVLQRFHDILIDDDRPGECFACVHHAVADGIDLIHTGNHAVMLIRQKSQHLLHCRAVIGEGHIGIINILIRGCMLDMSANPDSLTQTLGKHLAGIGIHQLILQGRATCINNQYFHCSHALLNLIHFRTPCIPENKEIQYTYILDQKREKDN